MSDETLKSLFESLKEKNLHINKHLIEIILVVVFLIGVFSVYIYQIDHPSTSLFCDEAAIGYNAYSISQTLRDENDTLLPLYIRNFLGHKMPVYVYLSAIIMKFTGLSVFSTRLLAVLCGIFTILFIYLLGRKYFNRFTGASAAIFLALTPGFFHLQRIAFELTTVSCFMLGSVYFWGIASERKSRWYSIIAVLFLILAWYSYVPAQVFILATAVLLALTYVNHWKSFVIKLFKDHRKKLFAGISVFIVFFVIPWFVYMPDMVKTRHVTDNFILKQGHQVLNHSRVMNYIKDNMGDIHQQVIELPVIAKQVIVGTVHYFKCYSPGFLFDHGDNLARHLAPDFGPFNSIFIVLLPVGIIVLLNNIKKLEYRLLFIAFIAGGIPSALIIEDVQLTHNIYMFPVFALIAAVGLNYICQEVAKPLYLKVSIFVIVLFCMLSYFHLYYSNYFNVYITKYEHDWQARRVEILDFIDKNKSKYKQFYVSGQIHEIYMHLLFYGTSKYNFNPGAFQKDKKLPFNIKILEHELYLPAITAETINTYYGDDILLILNERELDYHPSVKEFKYQSEIPYAVAKEFRSNANENNP